MTPVSAAVCILAKDTYFCCGLHFGQRHLFCCGLHFGQRHLFLLWSAFWPTTPISAVVCILVFASNFSHITVTSKFLKWNQKMFCAWGFNPCSILLFNHIQRQKITWSKRGIYWSYFNFSDITKILRAPFLQTEFITSTHFIDLREMNVWVDDGVTLLLLTYNPWIVNWKNFTQVLELRTAFFRLILFSTDRSTATITTNISVTSVFILLVQMQHIYNKLHISSAKKTLQQYIYILLQVRQKNLQQYLTKS